MRETKQQYIYEYIRQKVISNEYAPGMQLTEAALSEELQVSRTPVREALNRLITEGYLVSTPGVGLSVPNISLIDFLEIYDIRETLEELAIHLFFENYTDQTVDQLKNILIAQTEAYEQRDYTTFMKADMEFHHVIFSVAGNRRLTNSLNSLYNQINRLAFIHKNDVYIHEMALGHHTAIYKCILTGDKDMACKLTVTHIQDLRKYYLKNHFNVR